MSERLNGGPFVIGPAQDVFIEYAWGQQQRGQDRHLAYACAHPIVEELEGQVSLLSSDQRSLWDATDFEGGSYYYGFTVHNDSTSHSQVFDVYATTP